MFTLQVKRYGMLPEQLAQKVEMQFISVKDGLQVLAIQVRDTMRQNVINSIIRDGSTGNLVRAIEYYIEDSPMGRTVGIGNISEMNIKAAYWYLMNYGGLSGAAKHGTTLRGYFGTMIAYGAPDPRFKGVNAGGEHIATQQWHPIGQGGYAMTPQFPIAPKNYIEKTSSWLMGVIRIHYNGWLNKTQSFST